MNKKRIYIVRHGEAEGNVQGFSQTDTTPLTETGEKQASIVADRCKALPIEAVYASRMRRAQQTAAHLAKLANIDVVETEYFHEFTKPSSVQMLPHEDEAYQVYAKAEKESYADSNWRYEDGETFADIRKRVEAGLTFLEECPYSHIALVSHGRLIQFMVAYVLHNQQLSAAVEQQLAERMVVTNTGITVFEYDQDVWKLITFNDFAHFAEELWNCFSSDMGKPMAT